MKVQSAHMLRLDKNMVQSQLEIERQLVSIQKA
jgi:hypothetical protein